MFVQDILFMYMYIRIYSILTVDVWCMQTIYTYTITMLYIWKKERYYICINGYFLNMYILEFF